jgi:hypothetical protein
MVGLMTIWFGPFVEMRPDTGYFYLCPACYRERIKPHLDEVQNRLFDLHPLARRLGLYVDAADLGPEVEVDPDRAPTPVPAGGGRAAQGDEVAGDAGFAGGGVEAGTEAPAPSERIPRAS